MKNLPDITPAVATPKTVDNSGNTITCVAIISASLIKITDLDVFLQYVLTHIFVTELFVMYADNDVAMTYKGCIEVK